MKGLVKKILLLLKRWFTGYWLVKLLFSSHQTTEDEPIQPKPRKLDSELLLAISQVQPIKYKFRTDELYSLVSNSFNKAEFFDAVNQLARRGMISLSTGDCNDKNDCPVRHQGNPKYIVHILIK